MNEPINDNDIEYNTYIDTREQYIDGMNNQRDRLDGYLIKFSAGIFGISFAFITDIVGDLKSCSNRPLLILAWGFFALTILVSLGSFMFSEKDFNRMRKELDEIYKRTNIVGRNIKSSKLIDVLNIFSIALFMAGVIILFIFIIKNIGV